MKKSRIPAMILSMAMLISTLGSSSVYMASTSDNQATDADLLSEYRGHLNYRGETNLDFDYSIEGESGISRNWGTLPNSYSSSAYVDWDFEKVNNYITPVKDQNPYGTCWAHSTIAAAEASYIINTGITNVSSVDFNEYHLVHYTYDTPENPLGLFGGDKTYLPNGDSFLDVGGSNQITATVLANWIGASDSTTFSSSDVEENNSDALGFEDKAHLENAYFISMSDKNVVKEMVMKYGALTTSYCSTDVGGNEFDGYYYCPTAYATNHAITIVGWDDSIPANAFKTTAPGNGAWLVKNSWSSYGEFGGYFWLSYYDASIAEDGYVYDMAPADNYDNNYQYDGSGSLDYTGYYENVVFANAFVADSDETLEAVGFYTYDVDLDYEIRVYKNLEANEAPQYGDLVLTQKGKEIYAGYHTVDLTSSIAVSENERYAVVVTLSKTGVNCYVGLDATRNYGWIAFESYSKAGESYMGYSIDSLYDLNTSNSEYAEGNNVRLKAYTNEGNKEDEGSGVPVESATLVTPTVNPMVGEQIQLTLEVTPSNAEYTVLGWSSSDENRATVDQNGLVTVRGTGYVSISVEIRYDGMSRMVSTLLSVKEAKVTDIILSETSLTLDRGDTVKLTAIVKPDFIVNKEITWSSSDESVATVDENGVVTAQGPGWARIRARSADGFVSQCEITVRDIKVTEITLNKTSVELQYWDRVELIATVTPEDADNKEVIWSSSDESVAAVDDEGMVIAYGVGTAVITATAADGSGVSASCTVTVIPTKVTEIIISNTSIDLYLGDSHTMEAEVLPYEAANRNLIWTSSNPEVATIDENGKVTAVGIGSAIITATAADGSGISDSCVINVTKLQVSYIVLDKYLIELDMEESYTLTASVYPENAPNKNVIWTSSNPEVATVDENGKVTAVGGGAATITVTAADGSGISVTCSVMVTEKKVGEVDLNVYETRLFIGETFTLIATIKPSDAYNKKLIWTSSNPEVATVDENGVVTALSEGSTAILVEAADGSGAARACVVYVDPHPEIVLDEESFELNKGDGWQVIATITPDIMANSEIIWTSSNPEVATVDENGTVHAVGAGTAVITATIKGTDVSASCTVTVKAKVNEVLNGWKYQNGSWYYYRNDQKVTGWLYDGGVWYYMNANGKMATGWVYDGGAWYYMKSSGAMATGWVQDGGVWYYMKSSGAMATGWVQDGGVWYYMKSSGAMATGWVRDGSVWYYMKSSGAMATGWVYDGGVWYYMKSGGAMATGWVYDSGAWYYMKSSGEMATGWIQDGGTWYYMYSNGKMASNTWIDGCYLNQSGAWVK